ncbi:MAG: hypothetical protein Q7R45_08375 [Sulfuricaulis sp.]|nr:hypothetical protein [Sulfuricaulis sp.]
MDIIERNALCARQLLEAGAEIARLRVAIKLLREAIQATISQADISLDLYCNGRVPECQVVYDQCVAALEQTK